MPAPQLSTTAPEDDRHFVTALARGLEVLSCFRSGEKLLGNQEIAQRCGLPKSTVSRLTRTLTMLGYLIHVPDAGKYRLGTATLALGSAMLTGLDVRQIARPLMQRLADFAQAEIALGTRDRHNMLYIEHCPVRSPSSRIWTWARAFRWPPRPWAAPGWPPARPPTGRKRWTICRPTPPNNGQRRRPRRRCGLQPRNVPSPG
jgi:hypothetical protein